MVRQDLFSPLCSLAGRGRPVCKGAGWGLRLASQGGSHLFPQVTKLSRTTVTTRTKLNVCVYYCSTYYKAVRVGRGGGEVEDMCYERLRAEANVN